MQARNRAFSASIARFVALLGKEVFTITSRTIESRLRVTIQSKAFADLNVKSFHADSTSVPVYRELGVVGEGGRLELERRSVPCPSKNSCRVSPRR